MSVFITPDILESLSKLQECKKDIAFFKNLKHVHESAADYLFTLYTIDEWFFSQHENTSKNRLNSFRLK